MSSGLWSSVNGIEDIAIIYNHANLYQLHRNSWKQGCRFDNNFDWHIISMIYHISHSTSLQQNLSLSDVERTSQHRKVIFNPPTAFFVCFFVFFVCYLFAIELRVEWEKAEVKLIHGKRAKKQIVFLRCSCTHERTCASERSRANKKKKNWQKKMHLSYCSRQSQFSLWLYLTVCTYCIYIYTELCFPFHLFLVGHLIALPWCEPQLQPLVWFAVFRTSLEFRMRAD